jgi:hypothetical protein
VLSQTWIVAPVVVVSFAYAGWTLAPASARRWGARQLLRLPLPAALRQWAQLRALAASGCGCNGCDQKPASHATPGAAQPTVQPLVFRPAKGLKSLNVKDEIGR